MSSELKPNCIDVFRQFTLICRGIKVNVLHFVHIYTKVLKIYINNEV